MVIESESSHLERIVKVSSVEHQGLLEETLDAVEVRLAELLAHAYVLVPVLDDGQLAGIVSIGDVVKRRMDELAAERQQLQAYITQGG